MHTHQGWRHSAQLLRIRRSRFVRNTWSTCNFHRTTSGERSLVYLAGIKKMYAVVATQTYRIVANLFFRVIYPFRLFPFCLWALTEEGTDLDTKHKVVQDFATCTPGCCEACLASPLRSVCSGDCQELLSDSRLLDIIRAACLKCPCHNIQNEDRFAQPLVRSRPALSPGTAKIDLRHP